MSPKMLNKTCTISRATEVQNNNTTGETVFTPANAATSVSCAIQEGGSAEAVRWMRETGEATYTAYLPSGTDLRASDRLSTIANKNGSTSEFSGLILTVIGIPTPDVGRGEYLKAICKQATGNPLL